MSNHDDTDTPARATVPQLGARLLLLQQREQLPDPIFLAAKLSGGEVHTASRADFTAWLDALGGPGRGTGVHESRMKNGTLHVWVYIHDWDGTGHLVALEFDERPSTTVTHLHPETVEALTDLAAVPA